MTKPSVQLTIEGTIASLRFANPPRHTLTADMVTAMHEQVATLEARRDVRVLTIRSATPGVFITHYEVGELAQIADLIPRDPKAAPVPQEQELHALNKLMLRLEALDIVTIAVMDGLAMGGGLELALGCDFRLLCDGAHVVGLPETGVGIIPGAGGTQRMARLLGTARALDLILHGALLTPKDALEAGLVHRVYAPEHFDEQVTAFVGNLAARAPRALALAKSVIRAGVEQPLREGLMLEQRAFARAMATADARNAMRAYLKGERYTFKGE